MLHLVDGCLRVFVSLILQIDKYERKLSRWKVGLDGLLI